jgi:hypothetical protein
MRVSIKPLMISLTCALVAWGGSWIIIKRVDDAIKLQHQNYAFPDTVHLKRIIEITMGCAGIIHFVALAFLIRYIITLSTIQRAWACVIVVLPASYLSFLAVLEGLPGQTHGGGYITEELLLALLVGCLVGLIFILWFIVSLYLSFMSRMPRVR